MSFTYKGISCNYKVTLAPDICTLARPLPEGHGQKASQ